MCELTFITISILIGDWKNPQNIINRMLTIWFLNTFFLFRFLLENVLGQQKL